MYNVVLLFFFKIYKKINLLIIFGVLKLYSRYV